MTLHATTPGGRALQFKAHQRVEFIAPPQLLSLFDHETVPAPVYMLDSVASVCPGCGNWQVEAVTAPSGLDAVIVRKFHGGDQRAAEALAWEHLDECAPLAMLAGFYDIRRPVRPNYFDARMFDIQTSKQA